MIIYTIINLILSSVRYIILCPCQSLIILAMKSCGYNIKAIAKIILSHPSHCFKTLEMISQTKNDSALFLYPCNKIQNCYNYV